jgi:hypothetical protein
MKKFCKKCNQEKDTTEFNPNKHTKCGLQAYCKDCAREYCKQWKLKNKDKVKKYPRNSLQKVIRRKLVAYKLSDLRKCRKVDNFATVSYIEKKLRKCNNKCHYCDCDLKLFDYEPGCLTQFTIDRTNNKKGHVKGNIVICCLHCNIKKNTIPYKEFKNGSYKLKRSKALIKAQKKYYLKMKALRQRSQSC